MPKATGKNPRAATSQKNSTSTPPQTSSLERNQLLDNLRAAKNRVTRTIEGLPRGDVEALSKKEGAATDLSVSAIEESFGIIRKTLSQLGEDQVIDAWRPCEGEIGTTLKTALLISAKTPEMRGILQRFPNRLRRAWKALSSCLAPGLPPRETEPLSPEQAEKIEHLLMMGYFRAWMLCFMSHREGPVGDAHIERTLKEYTGDRESSALDDHEGFADKWNALVKEDTKNWQRTQAWRFTKQVADIINQHPQEHLGELSTWRTICQQLHEGDAPPEQESVVHELRHQKYLLCGSLPPVAQLQTIASCPSPIVPGALPALTPPRGGEREEDEDLASYFGGRLQFDDATHIVYFDGEANEMDHAPTYNAFRFVAESEGQLVLTEEIQKEGSPPLLLLSIVSVVRSDRELGGGSARS